MKKWISKTGLEQEYPNYKLGPMVPGFPDGIFEQNVFNDGELIGYLETGHLPMTKVMSCLEADEGEG